MLTYEISFMFCKRLFKCIFFFLWLGFVVQLVNAQAHALFQCVLLISVWIFCFWYWTHWCTTFTAAVGGFLVLDPPASEVNINKFVCLFQDEGS